MSWGSVTWTVTVPAPSSSFGTRKVSWLNEPDCRGVGVDADVGLGGLGGETRQHDGDTGREGQPAYRRTRAWR